MPATRYLIIGENDPEMYWAQIAAHALHCQTCCVFSDASPQDIHYVINSTDATLVFAHDQEQVDKLLELKDGNPQILRVVYWNERGMWGYDDSLADEPARTANRRGGASGGTAGKIRSNGARDPADGYHHPEHDLGHHQPAQVRRSHTLPTGLRPRR